MLEKNTLEQEEAPKEPLPSEPTVQQKNQQEPHEAAKNKSDPISHKEEDKPELLPASKESKQIPLKVFPLLNFCNVTPLPFCIKGISE